MELDEKIPKSLIIKLQVIINDDGIREPVLTNYRFLEETLSIAFSDIHEGLNLHLLSEVVNGDDKKLSLSECWG